MIKNIGLSFVMSACIISCGSRSKSIENVDQFKREISYIIEDFVKNAKKEWDLIKKEGTSKNDQIKEELRKRLMYKKEMPYDKISIIALKWKELNTSESEIISFIVSEIEKVLRRYNLPLGRTGAAYENELYNTIFGNGPDSIIYED